MAIDPVSGKEVTNTTTTNTTLQEQNSGSNQTSIFSSSNYLPTPLINTSSSYSSIPLYGIPSAPIPQYSDLNYSTPYTAMGWSANYGSSYGNSYGSSYGSSYMTKDQYNQLTPAAQRNYDETMASQNRINEASLKQTEVDLLKGTSSKVTDATAKIEYYMGKSSFSLDSLAGTDNAQIKAILAGLTDEEKEAVNQKFIKDTGKPLELAKIEKDDNTFTDRAVSGAITGTVIGTVAACATAGSIVPGPGTLLGAGVGLVAGLAVGIGSYFLSKSRS